MQLEIYKQKHYSRRGSHPHSKVGKHRNLSLVEQSYEKLEIVGDGLRNRRGRRRRPQNQSEPLDGPALQWKTRAEPETSTRLIIVSQPLTGAANRQESRVRIKFQGHCRFFFLS